jgi:hypothetical protein
MKKIIIYSGLACSLLLGSCKKDLTSLNIDTKNPSNVPSYTLFTYAQKNLASTLASANVNTNIFRLITQHWTETTYTDESNYDLATRNIPQNWWHVIYRDVLRNLEDSKTLIPTDVLDAKQQKNELAIIDIMKVYTYHYLFTTFGNVPYSAALDINNTQPKYDDAKTAYAAMLSSLDAAIAKLDASGKSFGGADVIYGGDVAKWKMFAASFKLKMAMMMADYDATAAASAASAAVATGVFAANADNASFGFLSAPPNTNPIWVDLVQSGRKDFVAANTLVDAMKANNDPRVSLYFTTDASSGYSGGICGEGNNYSTFSKPAASITDPAHPYILMDYSEVEFLLAEAAARGMSVTGTAQSHYNAAVTASITAWGGNASDATTYLAQSSVAYDAANYKKSIGNQKWVSLYDRGHDAWTEWRRLDFPVLVAPINALSVTPVRFTYPVSEQNLNKTNYAAAATAVGGDMVDKKLWFDKN